MTIAKRLFGAYVLAAATFVGTTAHAAVLRFDLAGTTGASWSINTDAPPFQIDQDGLVYASVPGTYGTTSPVTLDVDFFSAARGGGLRLTDFDSGDIVAWFGGTQLYSVGGPISFDTGAFLLVDAATGARATLSVTSAAAVPEPSTWTMLIAGFGATGAILRRRRLRAAIQSAA